MGRFYVSMQAKHLSSTGAALQSRGGNMSWIAEQPAQLPVASVVHQLQLMTRCPHIKTPSVIMSWVVRLLHLCAACRCSDAQLSERHLRASKTR